jgi:hypothetical protein
MSTAKLPHAGPRLDFDPVRPDPQAKCYDLLFMRLFIGVVGEIAELLSPRPLFLCHRSIFHGIVQWKIRLVRAILYYRFVLVC